MRWQIALVLLAAPAFTQTSTPQPPRDDVIRIQEFYRLAAQIQDQIWPKWRQVPAPLLLVTADAEFLTRHPAPPKEFIKVGEDVYTRPRQFRTDFQATFPAFGPPSVIVIGEPKNTLSKTSTPWICTVMHEHFHQLQNAQPNYTQGLQDLGLSHGDTSGMWMLNYPFPYEKPEVARGFKELRDLLLETVNTRDEAAFAKLAKKYLEQRRQFLAQLSPEDHRYFSFQLWQEGIARYTEVKSAEAVTHYQPTVEYAALPDAESFSAYAEEARKNTLEELKQADLATWKRTVVYSFGAAEGFLLDRLNPKWKDEYFRSMFSTDSYFESKR